MPLPDDIRDFFDRYREAFDRMDGDAIAALYSVPSGIVSDGVYLHWPSAAPIRENMRALCELYSDNGYSRALYAAAAFLPQGSDNAIADVVWTIERRGERAAWRFNTTYNLLRTPDGWRVLLCTAYQEKRLAHT